MTATKIKLDNQTVKNGVITLSAGKVKDGKYNIVLVPAGVDDEYCATSDEKCG